MVSIRIVGAGAIGSFFAASLMTAGFDVAVVARAATRERLRQSGITLARGGGRETVFPALPGDGESAARPDIAVLCTKSQDLASAMDSLEAFRDDPPILVTVQNGVDAPQQAASRFSRAVVLAARVHGFFELDGDGVRHVGVTPSVLFGGWKAPAPAAERLFGEALDAAGIANRASATIEADLWEKLLLASSIGGVGAALGLPAGQIMRDDPGRAMLASAMGEVAGLAARRGIDLPVDCVGRTLAFVSGFPPEATSSLQRDLEACRPSEFDALTGAVVRMAAEVGHAVPVHRRVVDLLAERGLIGGGG